MTDERYLIRMLADTILNHWRHSAPVVVAAAAVVGLPG